MRIEVTCCAECPFRYEEICLLAARMKLSRVRLHHQYEDRNEPPPDWCPITEAGIVRVYNPEGVPEQGMPVEDIELRARLKGRRS